VCLAYNLHLIRGDPEGTSICVWQFPLNFKRPEIRRIENLKFLSISRYKFNTRYWFNLNLHSEIWGCRFGGFQGCNILSQTASHYCSTPLRYFACFTCDPLFLGLRLIFVRSQISGGKRPISEKMGGDGKTTWLKSVETLVRPLWRAAGSGAKAPPLAARPIVRYVLLSNAVR